MASLSMASDDHWRLQLFRLRACTDLRARCRIFLIAVWQRLLISRAQSPRYSAVFLGTGTTSDWSALRRVLSSTALFPRCSVARSRFQFVFQYLFCFCSCFAWR